MLNVTGGRTVAILADRRFQLGGATLGASMPASLRDLAAILYSPQLAYLYGLHLMLTLAIAASYVAAAYLVLDAARDCWELGPKAAAQKRIAAVTLLMRSVLHVANKVLANLLHFLNGSRVYVKPLMVKKESLKTIIMNYNAKPSSATVPNRPLASPLPTIAAQVPQAPVVTTISQPLVEQEAPKLPTVAEAPKPIETSKVTPTDKKTPKDTTATKAANANKHTKTRKTLKDATATKAANANKNTKTKKTLKDGIATKATNTTNDAKIKKTPKAANVTKTAKTSKSPNVKKTHHPNPSITTQTSSLRNTPLKAHFVFPAQSSQRNLLAQDLADNYREDIGSDEGETWSPAKGNISSTTNLDNNVLTTIRENNQGSAVLPAEPQGSTVFSPTPNQNSINSPTKPHKKSPRVSENASYSRANVEHDPSSIGARNHTTPRNNRGKPPERLGFGGNPLSPATTQQSPTARSGALLPAQLSSPTETQHSSPSSIPPHSAELTSLDGNTHAAGRKLVFS